MQRLLPQLALAVVAALLCNTRLLAVDSPADRYRQLAAPYEQADPAGKLRWLEDLLLNQAEPACRVFMTPEQLQLLRRRHQAILSRAAAGHELSDSGVQRLLAEVDAQQQQAISKLRRDYAFATAQGFHNDRAEFEKWYGAWHNIEHKYLAAGEPFAWQPKIIAWLQQAGERQANLKPAPQTERRIVRRSENPAIRAIPPRTGPSIQRDELEARIAGYNLALSRLVAELHTRERWTAEQIVDSANDLSSLATARHDLELYWNLLPAHARDRMPPLDSLDGAISLLASRTSQRRRELEVSPAATGSREAWELRRLDDVSRRLATLASARS